MSSTEFLALRPEWDEIWRPLPGRTPFLHSGWMYAWYGVDPRFARVGARMLSIAAAIEGASTFEFLRRGEADKNQWRAIDDFRVSRHVRRSPGGLA